MILISSIFIFIIIFYIKKAQQVQVYWAGETKYIVPYSFRRLAHHLKDRTKINYF